MNDKITILKEILKKGLNYERDYSHTIILEEREDRVFINQYIPLKIYKGKDLYSGIHVQSIEIDPEFPDRVYFHQYLNKRNGFDDKVIGLKTPTYEAGWSRSISSIKGNMKIKEREEKGEVLFKDEFSKMRAPLVNWDKDLKPNTRKNETTMYSLSWDVGKKGKLYYSISEVLEDCTSRFIIAQELDLEKVSELLADDEEYDYLNFPEDEDLLIPSFIKLMAEDKELRHIIRALASEDGKDHYEATDCIKNGVLEEDISEIKSEIQPDKEIKSQATPQPIREGLGPVCGLHPVYLTILLDKLIDCEVNIPDEDIKQIVDYLLMNYKGENLKYIINKLTEE